MFAPWLLGAPGFPEVLSSGRPYYDLAMYTAQLDEVFLGQSTASSVWPGQCAVGLVGSAAVVLLNQQITVEVIERKG